MIPLLHEFAGAAVLVFGGGRVGGRKARRFATEADVFVISPTFRGNDFGDAHLIRAHPGPTDVSEWIDRIEPVLVVAATDDPTINSAIERVTRDRGLLVNRADRHENHVVGDVIVPATVRDGPVIIAIGTHGISPSFSRRLRARIEAEYSGAGELASITAEVRNELIDRDVDPDTRRRILDALVESDRAWQAARTSAESLRTVADEIVSEMQSNASKSMESNGDGRG